MSDRDEASIAAFCVQLGARTIGPHFYRCGGCCEVFTSDERLDVTSTRCVCGYGGNAKQALEYMGQAKGDSLTKESERCPCDYRCTGARGPDCECVCNGINHGAGLTVTIERKVGEVPTVLLRDPEKAKARRAEAIAAYHAAEARIKATFAADDLKRYALRIYLAPEKWQAIREAKEQLAKAATYKTHSKRIEALNQISKL